MLDLILIKHILRIRKMNDKNKRHFKLIAYAILPLCCFVGYVLGVLFINLLGFAINYGNMIIIAISFVPVYLMLWFQLRRFLLKNDN
jgi:hypothetical protein